MINKCTLYVKRYLDIVFRAFSTQIITHFVGRSNENVQSYIHDCLETFQDASINCLDIFSFSNIFTVRKEVAKVMFLHVSVILFTGGVSAPGGWCLLPGDVSAPGGSALRGGLVSQHADPPPWERRLLLRMVRIILGCILVQNKNKRFTS